jgi:hypothetical protein
MMDRREYAGSMTGAAAGQAAQSLNQQKVSPQTVVLAERLARVRSTIDSLNGRSCKLASRLLGAIPEPGEKKESEAPNSALTELHLLISNIEDLLTYSHRQLERLEEL